MHYTQITDDERSKIDLLWNVQKKSVSQISRILKRSKSTISRELKRNLDSNKNYLPERAKEMTKFRQSNKLKNNMSKYEEFTALFVQFYDKRIHGIEATWNKIRNMNVNFKIPSCRQVFRWIKSNNWVVKNVDRLKKDIKRKNEIG